MQYILHTGLRLPYTLNDQLLNISKEKGISKNSLIVSTLWKLIKEDKGERQTCMNQ